MARPSVPHLSSSLLSTAACSSAGRDSQPARLCILCVLAQAREATEEVLNRPGATGVRWGSNGRPPPPQRGQRRAHALHRCCWLLSSMPIAPAPASPTDPGRRLTWQSVLQRAKAVSIGTKASKQAGGKSQQRQEKACRGKGRVHESFRECRASGATSKGEGARQSAAGGRAMGAAGVARSGGDSDGSRGVHE